MSRSVPYFFDSISDVIAVAKFAISVFLLSIDWSKTRVYGIGRVGRHKGTSEAFPHISGLAEPVLLLPASMTATSFANEK
jgi:hypothetical protein